MSFTLDTILENPEVVGIPREHVRASTQHFRVMRENQRYCRADVYFNALGQDFFVFFGTLKDVNVSYRRRDEFKYILESCDLSVNPIYVVAYRDPTNYNIIASEWKR